MLARGAWSKPRAQGQNHVFKSGTQGLIGRFQHHGSAPASARPSRHYCTQQQRTCIHRLGGRHARGHVTGAAAEAAAAAGGDQALPDAAEGSTLYIRSSLSKGQAIRHEGGSVCVFGDVPAGCVVVAAGDVVVMGCLEGEAQAESPIAMVAALGFGKQAEVSVGGIKAKQVIRQTFNEPVRPLSHTGEHVEPPPSLVHFP